MAGVLALLDRAPGHRAAPRSSPRPRSRRRRRSICAVRARRPAARAAGRCRRDRGAVAVIGADRARLLRHARHRGARRRRREPGQVSRWSVARDARARDRHRRRGRCGSSSPSLYGLALVRPARLDGARRRLGPRRGLGDLRAARRDRLDGALVRDLAAAARRGLARPGADRRRPFCSPFSRRPTDYPSRGGTPLQWVRGRRAEHARLARVRADRGDPRAARAGRRRQRRRRPERIRLGAGDDAAITVPGGATATTIDAIVDGVHFRSGWCPPHSVGRKAMATALSDLAAMGAEPGEAYVWLGRPPWLDPEGVLELCDGLADRRRSGRRRDRRRRPHRRRRARRLASPRSATPPMPERLRPPRRRRAGRRALRHRRARRRRRRADAARAPRARRRARSRPRPTSRRASASSTRARRSRPGGCSRRPGRRR